MIRLDFIDAVDQQLVEELLSVISQWRENDHWQVRLFLIFFAKSQLIFTVYSSRPI